ncbi:DUF5353 domain-containing protein [Paenibacillus sp. N3/727]|uniref:DUF5353 domain-containing protein n=1 Tax=Paenibacillus sp. N3/727 TaxID=2925845 RepID=UPI001F53492D|nr:DUF5353 domain-containing protein [Paenibacillus sp. N3/727]UNK20074.1 DUF5353 domain-containing protein [Paenibacillus sp. N3/727]
MSKDKKRKKNNFKVVDSKRSRVDYPRKDHQEEYAAEVAPPVGTSVQHSRSVEREVDDASTGRIAGYVGLGIGIASLFMWSVILGPIAAVIGFYAYSQDRKTLGAWSMVLGILATISYFVLIPFAR